MKKILFILFFLSLTSTIYSQNFQITGQVNDTANSSLPGAGVTLLNPLDSSIVDGTLTDINGNFTLNNVTAGKIILKISFLGFRDKYLNREITNQ